MEELLDVLVIGAGPGGLTAGLYTARSGLRTVAIEKLGVGGQAAITDLIENYPGFPDGVGGWELSEWMKQQAERFGVEVVSAEVQGITTGDGKLTVSTTEGEFRAVAVIVATGASPRKLGVPGEEALRGKGVSYCATCDGPLFKGKDVVVVGGGETAAQEAMFLANYCRSVTIVHRRARMRAPMTIQKRLEAKDNVRFVWSSVVREITGDDKVTSVKVVPATGGEDREIACDGVFIFVGYLPNSDFLHGTVELDQRGYVIADELMQTNVKGVFACGDVRKKRDMQVVVACGEAAIAALSAQHYVEELKGTAYE